MRREGARGAVGLSHLLLRGVIKPGDRVVDATCGNGNDTLFLAQLVGPSGKVWGMDIQGDAVRRTASRLAEAGCLSWVELIHAGHERIAEYVRAPVQAVVFNLGWLPGSDKGVVTRPETTISALEDSLQLLLPGGAILIAVYTGHTGGTEEESAVTAWATALPPESFNVWRSRQMNCPPLAPYLLLVEKAGDGAAAAVK